MAYYDTIKNIKIVIESLKIDAIEGIIPTWYAYAEIDRLEKLIKAKG